MRLILDSYDRLDKLDDAAQWYRRAYALRDKSGIEDLGTASLAANLGTILSQSRSPKSAVPMLVRAYSIRRTLLGPSHPDTVDSMYDLGLLYANLVGRGGRADHADISQGNLGEASSLLKQALSVEPNHDSVPEALLVLDFVSQGRMAGRAKPAQ